MEGWGVRFREGEWGDGFYVVLFVFLVFMFYVSIFSFLNLVVSFFFRVVFWVSVSRRVSIRSNK